MVTPLLERHPAVDRIVRHPIHLDGTKLPHRYVVNDINTPKSACIELVRKGNGAPSSSSSLASPTPPPLPTLLQNQAVPGILAVAAASRSDSPQDARKLVLEVKERLGKEFPALPVGRNGRDDEDMIYWFLKDRKFVADDAFAKLAKAIKWRQEFEVSKLTEESVEEIARTGKAYVHHHLDVSGRPVLVVVAAKHFPNAQDPIENEKLCVFLIEKALSKLPPGQEQILGIFDLRGFGTANADLKFLTYHGMFLCFDVFYYYYPKRLSQVLFVDAPFVFKPLWQIAKPLLQSYASLVRFCSADKVRSEYFTEETLPPNFSN
ncbi:hypothetical protein MLD38_039428 [Melastoma candidum]|uniref:Uncharacterized protein n=1 Tax=Melastoma candidum TaxID=119954 RepID=A0ACB9L2S3_9MYRT|nr:hypothetical protein MLD38_039428 [Melastoma candidum]